MIVVIGFSCVKTEWNCVLIRCSLCSGVVIRVSLGFLNAAMPVVSCLGLFLTLSGR